MKLKKSLLATAILLAGGMVGQAQASVYARAWTSIDNFFLDLRPEGAPGPGGAIPGTYSFALTNTGNLNGAADIKVGACSGTAGGATSCADTSPRLDADAANAPGSTVTRLNNVFTFFGPGADQYGNADSVIYTTQLLGDATTSMEAIAEAELQTGTSAGSTANMQSTTGFVFNFTVDEPGQLTIDFDALMDILVKIDDPDATAATAKSNPKIELTLTNDKDGLALIWSPNGDTTTGCSTVLPVLTCTEWADDFDLNSDLEIHSNPSELGRFNAAGSDHFSMTTTGLYAGDWTLGLTVELSTSLSRIPEPGTLALLGLGLAGFGFAGKRGKKKRA